MKTQKTNLFSSVLLGALLLAGCAQTTTRQTPELSKERRSLEPIVSLGSSFKALPAVSNVGLFLKLRHSPHLSRQSLSHVQHILLIF